MQRLIRRQKDVNEGTVVDLAFNPRSAGRISPNQRASSTKERSLIRLANFARWTSNEHGANIDSGWEQTVREGTRLSSL